MDFRDMRYTRVCDALSITQSQLESWKRHGMPGPPYDLAVIMEWRIAYECEKVAPKVTGADSEEALERKRHWDAENARLKNEQLKGQLLDRDEVLKEISDTTQVVRSTLMNLGSELSVKLARTNDALEIREMIDESVANKLGGLRLNESDQ